MESVNFLLLLKHLRLALQNYLLLRLNLDLILHNLSFGLLFRVLIHANTR